MADVLKLEKEVAVDLLGTKRGDSWPKVRRELEFILLHLGTLDAILPGGRATTDSAPVMPLAGTGQAPAGDTDSWEPGDLVPVSPSKVGKPSVKKSPPRAVVAGRTPSSVVAFRVVSGALSKWAWANAGTLLAVYGAVFHFACSLVPAAVLNLSLLTPLLSPFLLLLAPLIFGRLLGTAIYQVATTFPAKFGEAIKIAAAEATAAAFGQAPSVPSPSIFPGHLPYNETEAAAQAAFVAVASHFADNAGGPRSSDESSRTPVPIVFHPPSPPSPWQGLWAQMATTVTTLAIAAMWGGRAASPQNN